MAAPIATAKADFRKRSCLLYPRKADTSAIACVAQTCRSRKVTWDQWLTWARQEADRIDFMKNGMVTEAIRQHMEEMSLPE